MKKLITLLVVVFASSFVYVPNSYAGSVVPGQKVEEGVKPASQKEQRKSLKKKLRKIRKEYRTETKGMNKAEKRAFLMDKIDQEDADLGNTQYLIIGIIFLVISAIVWIIPGYIGWILSVIFGIAAAIFLILWLVSLLEGI